MKHEEDKNKDKEDKKESDEDDEDEICLSNADKYINKKQIAKFLELIIASLNIEDDGVIFESLATIKSIIKCDKAIDTFTYASRIIQVQKRF